MEGKIVKAQRAAMIKRRGQVEQANLPDERMRISTESNKQFVEKVKGNK